MEHNTDGFKKYLMNDENSYPVIKHRTMNGVPEPFFIKIVETPLGNMCAAAVEEGICMLEFEDRRTLPTHIENMEKTLSGRLLPNNHLHFKILEKELKEYFNEERKEFSVPLYMVGTDFQKAVWDILLKIPYGETWSYLQQAQSLGDARKVRAVANANGMNKISVIIPCHRVIGSNGTLTGYGGGIWRKEKLLKIEKSTLF